MGGRRLTARRACLVALLPVALVCGPRAAQAQRSVAAPIYQQNFDSMIGGAEDWLARIEKEGWFLRGQATAITQSKPVMVSPYSGEVSLTGKQTSRNTESIDLVIGRRLWSNAEFVVVPSVTRGFGMSNSQGVASFPNGEAFRLGTENPVAWLPRAFIRQTIPLSGDSQGTDPDPMRFTGPLPTERITITVGKFSVWDFFDDNRYAHDARTQFMQWGLVGTGAFDFAADARGFTEGGVVEWEDGKHALHAGVFRVAKDANSLPMDTKYLLGLQYLLQGDRSYTIAGQPGTVRLLGGVSHARSTRWNDLTQGVQAGLPRQVYFDNYMRNYRSKLMVGLNMEQQINPNLGVFARLGWNNGRDQNWMFTEMDWSVSGGVSVNGQLWRRPGDTVGLGFNVGGISAPHQRFLEAGGLGFITGDGRLNYGYESVIENYYDMRLAPGLNGALAWGFVKNPAYNRDRGPTPVFTARIHAAF